METSLGLRGNVEALMFSFFMKKSNLFDIDNEIYGIMKRYTCVPYERIERNSKQVSKQIEESL
jgi:hypothetical protein